MDNENVNQFLKDLSGTILTSTGCALCWGEEEVPDCWKQEGENKMEDQKDDKKRRGGESNEDSERKS